MREALDSGRGVRYAVDDRAVMMAGANAKGPEATGSEPLDVVLVS